MEYGFVDVIVTYITDYGYTVVVATPAKILKVMNDDSVNFIKPEALIIVKQLTQQFIEQVVNEYVLNDGYWLKLHKFSGYMDISILNNLFEEHYILLEAFDYTTSLVHLHY